MTGLSQWRRDALLPERAGDALAVMGEDELRSLLERELLRPGAPALASVEWVYARWKPHTSVTCGYSVRFEDGLEATVVAKRYADGKERELALLVER